MFYLSII